MINADYFVSGVSLRNLDLYSSFDVGVKFANPCSEWEASANGRKNL
jgi:hypothetical protein